jgi:ribonuclease HII
MILLENCLESFYSNPHNLIAGVDEVGRGCLFGDVVAVAVVVPVKAIALLQNLGVKDSKKLTAKKRIALVEQIESIVIDAQMGVVDSETIDHINILQSSLQAMAQALNKLKVTPDLCLIDGKFPVPDLSFPQVTMVRGDGRSPVIASASILAKVWRDRKMIEYSQQYPHYDLENNKGYGTKKHLQAIKKYGITPHHRQSFTPVSQHLSSSGD